MDLSALVGVSMFLFQSPVDEVQFPDWLEFELSTCLVKFEVMCI